MPIKEAKKTKSGTAFCIVPDFLILSAICEIPYAIQTQTSKKTLSLPPPPPKKKFQKWCPAKELQRDW